MAEIIGYIGFAFIILIAIYLFFRERKIRKRDFLKSVLLQKELEKKIEELTTLNKEQIQSKSLEKFYSMGRVAATFAHELKNPLTNINLSVQELSQERGNTDPKLLDVINRNSHKIDSLINDFLNVTIFTELNLQKMSINDVLDEILLELSDRIILEKVEVTKDFSRDICDVSIDANKIKIAIKNIIANAIEAMDRGEGVLHISTKGVNDRCVIKIKDNGHGIDKTILNQIFDPYFSSKREKGSGLGLAQAQNIIFNHGGEIGVESKDGEGTTMTITLDFSEE